jgi:hypothetical protein
VKRGGKEGAGRKEGEGEGSKESEGGGREVKKRRKEARKG